MGSLGFEVAERTRDGWGRKDHGGLPLGAMPEGATHGAPNPSGPSGRRQAIVIPPALHRKGFRTGGFHGESARTRGPPVVLGEAAKVRP